MLAHIEAIKAALVPLGWQVHYVSVPESPVFPYVLLWSGSGDPGSEPSLCGPMDDVEAVVGVTVVAGSPEGVLTVQSAVRAVLSPGDARTPLVVAGRSASLKRTTGQAVQVDRDVKIPGTNTSPAFSVDLYDLHSTPAT